ncbi:MAG: hypothetical protein K8T26_01615 [Lentisphaerae bacterium]|nr:hypothetical protein [Lentisphaerota bacterium]
MKAMEIEQGVTKQIHINMPVEQHRNLKITAATVAWTLNDLVVACVGEVLASPAALSAITSKGAKAMMGK